EAVRAYHAVLEKLKLKPQRLLADDLALQTSVMSYGGRSSASVPAAIPSGGSSEKKHDCGCGGPKTACACKTLKLGDTHHDAASQEPALPDFKSMTQAEKLAYNQAKRD